MNINQLIKEVNEKYVPLKLSTKGREITKDESIQLFELSTKLDLYKIIKSLFMETITKDEGGKVTKYFVDHNLITFHKEIAKDKNDKEVEVNVVNESMDDRISMLPDEFTLPLFEKMVKSHKENIEIYTKKNDKELLKKEQYELDIINSFLPKEATKEDVLAWLNENYPDGITQKEMGPTIGKVKKAFERADGKMVSDCVRTIIHQ